MWLDIFPAVPFRVFTPILQEKLKRKREILNESPFIVLNIRRQYINETT